MIRNWTNRTALCGGLLLAVAIGPLFFGLNNDIQEFDPAQYAEVGRRMFESKDWAYMHDAFGIFVNKPPVTFWLMTGAFRLFGETSFAVRLPSLLMGLMLLWATHQIGRRLYDAPTGLWGCALLAASPAFQLMVADPKVDMVTIAFMAWAVFFMLKARERPGWANAAWICAALGNLSKGLVGLAVPAMAILPEALRPGWVPKSQDRGFWSRFFRLQPVSGLLLMVLLMLPWYLRLINQTGSYGPRVLLWNNSVGRIMGTSWRNNTTPLFFTHTALWAFLPFIPLLLHAIGRAAADWRRNGFRLPPDPKRILWWWIFLPFLVISVTAYRLPQYLYWLAPPAALVSARALLQFKEQTRAARVFVVIYVALIAILLAGIAGILVYIFPAPRSVVLFWLACFCAILGVGHVLWFRAAAPIRLGALAILALSAFNLFFEAHLHPALLAYQPDHRFAAEILKIDPQGVVLPFVRLEPTNASAFYARREVKQTQVPELVQLVSENKSRVAIVAPAAVTDLERAGLQVQERLALPSFGTSRPTGKFLMAATRPQVLEQRILVELSVKR